MAHPTPEKLLACAESTADGAVQRHVDHCPDCAAQVDAWRRTLAGLALPLEDVPENVRQRARALVIRQPREAGWRRLLAVLQWDAGMRPEWQGAREQASERVLRFLAEGCRIQCLLEPESNGWTLRGTLQDEQGTSGAGWRVRCASATGEQVAPVAEDGSFTVAQLADGPCRLEIEDPVERWVVEVTLELPPPEEGWE